MKYLVTGAAGFVGANVCQRLVDDGHAVVGVDNLNDYYDVALKHTRLTALEGQQGFEFVRLGIEDRETVDALFKQHTFDRVIHLAAQAGVRYSIENPHAYVDSNLVGFVNILEGCRHYDVGHLVYASSSSVYGANTTMPFSETHAVDHPVSLYAATKKSNEMLAHSYAHLYRLPVTGLRFFTVYGPIGRPDMAYFSFTQKMMAGEPINVFNHGKMQRDFTYIDDIVEGVVRIADQPATPDPAWSSDTPNVSTSNAPYRIFNIGNNNPVELGYFIETLENALGVSAAKNYLPMQAGDVVATYANIDSLFDAVGYRPATSIEEGLGRFASWYKSYYQ